MSAPTARRSPPSSMLTKANSPSASTAGPGGKRCSIKSGTCVSHRTDGSPPWCLKWENGPWPWMATPGRTNSATSGNPDSVRRRHIAAAVQQDMQYAMVLDGKPWDQTFANMTYFAMSSDGRHTAGAVQVEDVDSGESTNSRRAAFSAAWTASPGIHASSTSGTWPSARTASTWPPKSGSTSTITPLP
jgi:hypothetical protein